MWKLTKMDRYDIYKSVYIKANSQKEVANYIKNNVEDLWDPFFEDMVDAATEGDYDMYDGGGKLYPYLKTLDDELSESDYIKLITKFLKKLSPGDIFEILTFYQETGNKEDWQITISKVSPDEIMIVDLTK